MYIEIYPNTHPHPPHPYNRRLGSSSGGKSHKLALAEQSIYHRSSHKAMVLHLEARGSAADIVFI